MAFCPNCGTKLPDGAMFCGNCGSKQAPVQPQQPVYTPPVQQPVYEQPVQQPVYEQPVYGQPAYAQPEAPKKKKIWKILLPIIGGVVLLNLIIMLIFVLIFALSKTHVEYVTIVNGDELLLTVDDNHSVEYEVYPEEHDDTITWGSSDVDVATVRNGRISAEGEGSCTITVYADGEPMAEIEVEVYEEVIVGGDTSDVDLVVCGEWSSYGSYIDGNSDYYYGVDLYLYSDHTGVMYHDGDRISFEWSFDFSDTESHYYDAFTEDGGYFWFTYDYAGEYAGDLDVCLEEDFWVFFE